MTQRKQRRPQTYSRTFNATAEPRRAVGKFVDDASGKIKTCRFSIGTGTDAERKLATIQHLFETGGGDHNGVWFPGLLKAAKQIAAGETPSLWQMRADPKDYAQEVLAGREYNYANRPYRRMHEAIANAEEYWNLEKPTP